MNSSETYRLRSALAKGKCKRKLRYLSRRFRTRWAPAAITRQLRAYLSRAPRPPLGGRWRPHLAAVQPSEEQAVSEKKHTNQDLEKSPVRLKVERHLRRLMIPSVFGLEACHGTGNNPVVCDPMPPPADSNAAPDGDTGFAVPPPARDKATLPTPPPAPQDTAAPPPPVVCDPMPPPPPTRD